MPLRVSFLQLRVLLQDLRQAEVHHDGPEASRGVGVGHQHGDDRLTPQPLHQSGIGDQLGQEHLDGDLAVALDVTSEIDVRRPAFTDTVLDAVAPAERPAGETHISRPVPHHGHSWLYHPGTSPPGSIDIMVMLAWYDG